MRPISLTARLLAAALFLAPLATAQVAPEKQEALRKMADALEPTVEKLRGLEFKHYVPKGIKTEAELRAFMVQEVDKETPAEEFVIAGKMMAAMGLAPADLDVRQLLIDLMTEQVAGFYNPATQRLYLIARDGKKADGKENPMMEMQRQMFAMMGISEEEMYMAHELTHALEDQHFELLTLDYTELKDSDRMTGSKCLVEGTATVLMFDWLAGKLGIDPSMLAQQDLFGEGMDATSPTLARTPEYIQQQLVFPYSQGMKFVAEIKKRGGWKAVNEVYLDPPASTEQTLHPEKYLAADRDQPTLLEIPDLATTLGAGWTDLGRDVLGELGVRILLKKNLGKARAERVAAGWDGDVYRVVEGPNGRLALAFATTWDTEADATEFFEGYAAYLLDRHPARDVEKSATRIAWMIDGMQYAVTLDGLDVHAIAGIPDDKAPALLAVLEAIERKECERGLPKVKKIEVNPEATDGPAATGPADGKVTFETPDAWTRGTDDVLTHAAGGRIEILETSVPELSEPDLFEHVSGRIASKTPGYALVGQKPARVAGRIVRTIEYTGTPAGKATRFEVVFFKVGDHAIQITFSSPEAAIEGTRPGWEKVKQTLAVK